MVRLVGQPSNPSSPLAALFDAMPKPTFEA
jgi:hypothetical protein